MQRSGAYIVLTILLGAVGIGAVAVSRSTSARSLSKPQDTTAAASPQGTQASPGAPASVASTTQPPRLGPIPALDDSIGWINTAGINTAPTLTNKVTLYEFWTFGCYNCKNTLPTLRGLYKRYQADGLEIIGIHTPEFDSERDHGNVVKASADLAVTWPVVYDDDERNWQAWGNHYWPHIYVADQTGQVRFDHVGEGAYNELEVAIRTLLNVDPASPLSTPITK